MRVFVLSTGRCGSVTFARACGHALSHTSGHETNAGRIGAARFSYPDQHIEVDNRLSWFLGDLGRRFSPTRTLYVHLTRDREEVARSFVARWDSAYAASIIRAFANGIVMEGRAWPEQRRIEVCQAYVDTVTANIEHFLATQPHHLHVSLKTAERDFAAFWDRCGLEGDREAALAEWTVRHNATKGPDPS